MTFKILISITFNFFFCWISIIKMSRGKNRISVLNFNWLCELFFNRRQWYGLPHYVEEEKIPEMGTRGCRPREGRLEGSRKTHASVEEGGEGTCPHFFLYTHILC